MKWETQAIKTVYAGLYDGPHATPPDSDNGAIFLGISNITKDGRLNFSDIKYISEDDLPLWTKRVVPRGGDIVFSYEATLNRYAIIPEGFHGCLGRRMALIRPNEQIALGQFLYYYFFSDQWRSTIAENTVIGATVDRISLIKFPDFPVSIPELDVQKKIVEILSAYDNLIENNQKQIKLLEESAQRLYKEWFIDLRFPGYETTPVHDGVPEGWERKTIGELISYEIGGGWGEEMQSNNADNGAFVIRGTDLYGLTHGNLTEIPFRYHGESNLAARMLQDGDIVFEVSGGSRTEGVARTALVRENLLARYSNPVMCASFCKLIRPLTQEYSQYLYDHFQYLRSSGKTEEYDKRSASSIVNYRWKDFLSQETILKPSRPIIELYNQNAATIYNAIIAKSLQIETARNARDRLLPKLMSGEIEV